MNFEKIKKEYQKKIEKILKYNENYYDKNNPLISDNEYDELKKEILELEKKYDFLKHKNSPSKIVGFKPSKIFKKIQHKVAMLSLSNAFTEDDLINFEKRITNYLDEKKDFEIEYSAEPKIDGISASLFYKNGQFITGLSRGDVYIKNSDFKKISNKFATPRNAASGSLRQKNPEETKKIPLKFIAYTFGYEKNMQIDTQSDYLKYLSEWGFKINPLNKTIIGIKNLLKNYNEVEKKRSN